MGAESLGGGGWKSMVLKLYGFLPEAEWTLIFHNNCIFSITI